MKTTGERMQTLERASLGRDATAAQVIQAAIAQSVSRLVQHDSGVRIGADIEQVHQARVATRRLRSDLRTFRSLIDETWGEGLREELKWLADLLGAVRDKDVLLERLREAVMDLGPHDRRAAAKLLQRLEAEQASARGELLAAMDSQRYVDLLDRLLRAAADPHLGPEAEQPARIALAELVRKAVKHVDSAVQSLSRPSRDEELHNVRIRAKRARYAAEAAAPVWKGPAKKLAKAMASVQTVLGNLQDAVVTEEWLRRSGRGSVAQAFVAGELAAVQQSARSEARAEFPSVWKKASSAKLRSWLR